MGTFLVHLWQCAINEICYKNVALYNKPPKCAVHYWIFASSWPINESISPGPYIPMIDLYFFYLDPGQLIKSPFEENDEKQSDYEEDIDVPITNLASNRSSITVGWITASVVCT